MGLNSMMISIELYTDHYVVSHECEVTVDVSVLCIFISLCECHCDESSQVLKDCFTAIIYISALFHLTISAIYTHTFLSISPSVSDHGQISDCRAEGLYFGLICVLYFYL